MSKSVLHHKPESKFRDFKSTECPNVTFHFPAAFIHSSLYAAKLPSDVWTVVCAKWSIFFSNTIPADRWPHYKIFRACGTELLPTVSAAGLRSGSGRLICICTLKTVFPANPAGREVHILEPLLYGFLQLPDLFIQVWKSAQNFNPSSCIVLQKLGQEAFSANLEEEILRELMVHQFDKVDLNVYLRKQYYLVYYSRNTKMF